MSPSNLLGLILVGGCAGLMLFFYFRSRKDGGAGLRAGLREIPAFSRLRRGIGLSVEAGQRLHISLGRGGVSGLSGGSTLLGLALLARIARVASISDRPPVATSGESVQAILSQDTLKSAFRSVNAEAQYNPDAGLLTGVTPFSYAAGALPTIFDQDVSVNALTGSFGAEAALIADAAERSGSISMGGSENLAAQAVLFAATQEPLVGEELYGAGAYIQAGPMHTASIRAQDILRWVVIGGILIGALLKLVGII